MDIHKQAHTRHTYEHFDGQKNALSMFYGQIYIHIYIIYNTYICIYMI